MFCSSCGTELNENAVICPKCGCATPKFATASLPAQQGVPWGGGVMALLCVGSLAIPLLGWVLGGMNLKYPARKNQAVALIILGVSGFVIAIIAMSE